MTHYSVDRDRWSRLDIFNQMGNIYSEVERAFKTQRSNDHLGHKAAVTRAVDLLNATI